MSDLVTFVRTRLADRETLANAAFWDTGASAEWRAEEAPLRSKYHESWVVLDGLDDGVVGIDNPEAITAKSATQHIAANDPAYVLRDIAAKRAIVYAYEFTVAQYEKLIAHRVGSWEAGLLASAESAVRYLAAIDSDHPDYDEGWRP